jgi:hypothetical protein
MKGTKKLKSAHRYISTLTAIFVNQKTINACEHKVKKAPTLLETYHSSFYVLFNLFVTFILRPLSFFRKEFPLFFPCHMVSLLPMFDKNNVQLLITCHSLFLILHRSNNPYM